MTPQERLLLNRVIERASRESPAFARRLVMAWETIRAQLTERQIESLVRSGRLEDVLVRVLDAATLDDAFRELRILVDTSALEAAERMVRQMPPHLRGPFDQLNPRIVEAAAGLSTRVIEGLKDEIRESVRQHVIAGLTEGVGPREMARGIRETIGLAPNQEQAVRNFERMLREGDREALTRAWRDRRFDKTLRNRIGELFEDEIAKQVAAYRRKALQGNATTHARTVALDAQRMGQRMSWEDAISRGVVDRDQLRRKWITVGDDRVRPEHQVMHGEEAAFDQPYSNGETIPGETTYNCRCVERIVVTAPALVAA